MMNYNQTPQETSQCHEKKLNMIEKGREKRQSWDTIFYYYKKNDEEEKHTTTTLQQQAIQYLGLLPVPIVCDIYYFLCFFYLFLNDKIEGIHHISHISCSFFSSLSFFMPNL